MTRDLHAEDRQALGEILAWHGHLGGASLVNPASR